MTDQPQSAPTRPARRLRPAPALWIALIAWLVMVGLLVLIGVNLGRTGTELSDVPTVIVKPLSGGLFITMIWLAFEIGRSMRRPSEKALDPPETRSLPRTPTLLTAAISAALAVGFFQLEILDGAAGSIDDLYVSCEYASFWPAVIVARFFTPPEAQSWANFWRLFGIAFLSAAATYSLLILSYPGQARLTLDSIDRLGAYLHSVIESYA